MGTVRLFLAGAAFGMAAMVSTVSAQTTGSEARSLGEVLATDGLAAAEQHQLAQPPSPQRAFQLGGIQFLRSIEAILQIRFATYPDPLRLLPGMRLRIPDNPEARFDPAFLEQSMEAALEHLTKAQDSLKGAIGEDFSAEIQLADIWMDINANGQREEWEGIFEAMRLLRVRRAEDFDGVIRFDTADADWLMAYTHLISAMAELTLSVDPTPAIREASQSLEDFQLQVYELAGDRPTSFVRTWDSWPETITATFLALRGKPDRQRTRAAHAHFKAMVAHNKAFWTKIVLETDNDREWLPNPEQLSAFGVEVPAEMATRWQDVLNEIEAMLKGEALIPHWRIENENRGTGVGINLAKLMQDPPDMDLIFLLPGGPLAPYLEKGELADARAWTRFMRMTRGSTLSMAAWFN